MYHQSGSWGCFSVWLPVLATAAQAGGWTCSMFSLMYFASFSMKIDAGTSCGVVKILDFFCGFLAVKQPCLI